MAGIVAIYDPHGEAQEMAKLVRQMCTVLGEGSAFSKDATRKASSSHVLGGQDEIQRTGVQDVEWYAGPRTCMGRFRPALINLGPQPVWNRERTICLVFYGELYSIASATSQAQASERTIGHTGDAEIVLGLYETRGENFVQALNGSFVLALWDSRQQKFVVANDRYGLRPLYHARAGEAHLWASSPKAILAHPAYRKGSSRQVNLAAMADLFCLSIPQGNETIYDGISEVPPATLIVRQDKQANGPQLRQRQYWDLSFQEQETGKPMDDYVAELVYLLQQAARRRQISGTASPRAGLLLSGGHDSRVLLSVLDKGDLHAFTFGVPHCEDVRFARLAAKVSGIRHTALDIEPDYLAKFALRGIKRTEDLISCDLFHGISVYDQAAAQVDALITGSAGEDIFGHFSRDPQSAFWDEYFSVDRYYNLKRLMTDHDLEQLLTPRYYKSMQGLARERFHKDMARYPSQVRTHQVDYWSIRQQQRRLYNRLSSLFPNNLEFRPLYYDNDVIDFVQTIPPSGRWGEGSVYRQVLLHTAPELAQLPFTTTCGLALSASYKQMERRRTRRKQRRRWLRSAQRLSRGRLPLTCLPRWLTRTRIFHPTLYVDYGAWFRRELRDWVESILLSPRTLQREYWNAETIADMVQQHQQGRPTTRKIAILITFELWHRITIDEAPA